MPIKFEIYRDGTRVTTFAPVAAMAVGPESVPMPGDVAFRDGLLTLWRSDDHPSGLALLWDTGPLGTYHLETTRLPPRDEPYNLNVELARFRLMKIVQKQEDWNLFDFPRAEKFNQRFREAQATFADALGLLHQPGQAAQIADQALTVALDLSDQVAQFHGDLLLNRRRQSNALSKHLFGCRVDSTVINQKYKDTLVDHFDYAVLPMSWKQLQPEEGQFQTDPVDEWVDLLTRKRIPIIAGPLIDLSDAEVPDWMFIWEHDFETLRELAYEFVQKVVHRYRRAVSVWNVVGGLHTNSAFTLSFEQIIELTRLLVSQVKTILPNARTLVTIKEPFGEYHARGATSVPPMLYAEMVAQAGINFDAFVGAWKYFQTPAARRHLLPWYCHPVAWGIGLGLIAICVLKDTLGTATPTFLKKPLDVIELFENKLSAIVAAAAFVPLVAYGIKTFNEPVPGETAFHVQSAFPFLAMADLNPTIILVPFAIAGFLVVWLTFHVINVLIVLSPFGFIDALLKIARTGVVLLIPVSYLISPYFALAVCLIIFVVSCLVARWAFRLTLFGTLFALDLVPFRKFSRELLNKPIRAFTTRRIGTVPVRAYGSVQLNPNGQLMFTYRPWLLRAPKSTVLPGEAFALSKGLLCPVLLHKRTSDDRHRFLILLLPRYRSWAPEIALTLGLTDVRDGATARGLKAIRNWFSEMFRGRGSEKTASMEPVPGNLAS